MHTWDEIKDYVTHCKLCPLCQTRKHAVMGKGNLHPDIMFIAEAPGAKEDQVGIPFVGPAGQLFDQLLDEYHVSRKDIYITNIIKCHPPGNRNPEEREKDCCFPYLRYETYLLHPKIIVCLGRVAAQKLIDPNYRITKQHGQWVYRKGYYLTATYHPSALLRDSSKVADAKADLKKIIEKQRELQMTNHDNI